MTTDSAFVAETSAVERTLRPTSWLPFAAWVVLAFLQAVSPDRAWSWLLVGLSLLLVVSFLWALALRDRVTADRHIAGAWVVAGDELKETFTIVNDAPVPVLWARVADHSFIPGYSANRVESAPMHARRTWAGSGVCRRRGVFRVGPWELVMADPLGFFEVTHRYPATTTIMVYPRASHLPHLELPRGRSLGRSASSERSVQDTILVGGVRDYIPGDSLRRVHWSKTAHHDRLMVREFDREPAGDVWLVLDMDADVQAGQDAEATQEYGVILAASLAARFVREGERRAVGLLMSGSSPTVLPPARGQAQLWRILRALAEVEPASGVPLAGLLKQGGSSLGSGRTLVVITPSQNPDWIAALIPLSTRGNAPAALLVDATSFSPPRGDAEGLAAIRALLTRQQAPHYVVEQGFPFEPLDRLKRQRSELKTLPGTGRVIQVEVEEEV
jgi:uncharacterized protein (DUF58 family)